MTAAYLKALVDEAIAGLIEQRRLGRPRAHVMAAFEGALDRYAPLYDKLAKWLPISRS